jgi:uncharacterized UPF0160 family protein
MVLLLIKPAKALQKYIKKRKNKIIVFEQRLKEEKHRLMMAIKSQKPFMSFSRERIIFVQRICASPKRSRTRRENVKTFTKLHPINFVRKTAVEDLIY